MRKFYIKIFKITRLKFELHELIFVVYYKVEPVKSLNLVPKILKGEQFYLFIRCQFNFGPLNVGLIWILSFKFRIIDLILVS